MQKFLLSIALFALPFVTKAQGIFDIWEGTTCGGGGGGPTSPCSLCDGIIVTRNIVTSLFEVSLIIGGIMVAVGGILFMTSGGSQDKVRQARGTLTSALVGVVIALTAWVIINTLLSLIAGDGALPWNQITCS